MRLSALAGNVSSVSAFVVAEWATRAETARAPGTGDARGWSGLPGIRSRQLAAFSSIADDGSGRRTHPADVAARAR
jgi:hypothetical protein